jgi:hypothetical protein
MVVAHFRVQSLLFTEETKKETGKLNQDLRFQLGFEVRASRI